MRRRITMVTAVTAALVLAACGVEDPNDAAAPPVEPVDEEPADEAAPEPPADEDVAEEPAAPDEGNDRADEAPDTGDGHISNGLGAEIDLAVADAAATFGVAAADIEVVLAERVTWSDGSLGCPKPGEMYTQALVDGYRIVLSVDGQEVHYHGAEGDEPFRCERPIDPVDGATR